MPIDLSKETFTKEELLEHTSSETEKTRIATTNRVSKNMITKEVFDLQNEELSTLKLDIQKGKDLLFNEKFNSTYKELGGIDKAQNAFNSQYKEKIQKLETDELRDQEMKKLRDNEDNSFYFTPKENTNDIINGVGKGELKQPNLKTYPGSSIPIK